MPTIKDIAKAAGVSHGTVSNVLNGRGNVSVEKIKLVEDVAKKMGYQINARAKSLRAGSTKTVSLILPNISSEQYNKLYVAIENIFLKYGYSTTLYTTNDQKENEHSILEEIAANRDCAVIAVSCLSNANEYYEQLNINHENIIFVYRNLKNSIKFASFDFERIGRSIAKKMYEKKYQKIGIFTDLIEFTCSNDFKKGFMSELSKRNKKLKFLTISATHSTAYKDAFDFFAEDLLDVIVTTDIEKARYIKNAHFLGNTGKSPEIYSLSDSDFLIEDLIYKYHMNYQLLGKEIAETIIKNESNEEKDYSPIIVENKGFLFDIKKINNQYSEKTLNILTIPSPTTDALKKIIPHFKKTTGIEIRLAVYSFEEIYDILSDLENHKHYDIIRVDMAGLSWFAKKTLKPLNSLNTEINDLLSNYPKDLIDRYSLVNGITYAIPFDPSIQMLFYRKDIFEDTKVRRMFYEKYKRELKTPSTFNEFNLISEFFSQSKNPESPLSHGSCITTGNTEIIASEFLLRYYAAGGRLVQNNNTLSLTKEIASKALQNYMDNLIIAKNLSAKWWDESISLFSKGDIAMIIVYMNLFSTIAHSAISPLIGFSSVPGDKPLLGGGSLGVSKFCQKDKEVTEFFKWVYTNEIAEQITLLGGTSVNDFVYSNQSIMTQYPWLNFANEMDYKGLRESSFKSGQNFNLRKVEKIIGLGIKNAINNIMKREEAIDYINLRLSDNELFEP
ncbi:extracellular solute-binding protein [Bacillus sp. ISL-4]|uniref:extracellular solute-binding protein n=1 Tax=Bacillus sp. ISL-4 TaxID=2819125 RepID=UPI001BE860F4|nr:extracellular solute-binding protein [Bacillus sp. ISL-4]MBT2667840.1 extracellular solute-binding protein [Bacillus sp. ISL-4]